MPNRGAVWVSTETIRIISARKATRHEKAHYEND
jgi:uncharacterized DUF497 family protein